MVVVEVDVVVVVDPPVAVVDLVDGMGVDEVVVEEAVVVVDEDEVEVEMVDVGVEEVVVVVPVDVEVVVVRVVV